MGSTKGNSDLLSLIDALEDVPILVIGDLILDHYIWGKVDRISPEAPVVVVQVTEESKRPGGAGNVARNLASLGADVFIAGVVGDDLPGRELVAALEDLKINTTYVITDRTRPTTVKTRVIAHAQQIVRVDREVTTPLAEDYQQAVASALDSSLGKIKGVIVSDYAKGAVGAPLFQRIKTAFDAGQLGRSRVPVVVDPKGPNFSLYSRATVIKPNRREAEQASGLMIRDRAGAIVAGKKLLERWECETILVTLGENGMVIVSKEGGTDSAIEIETVAREVYDVSGAGDTVSAVFSLALAAGADLRQAARLANYAAGVVVAEVGTVAIELEKLRQAVQHPGE